MSIKIKLRFLLDKFLGLFLPDQSHEDKFKLALTAAPNGMMVVDSKGEILIANKKLEQIFGYGSDELVGMSVDQLVPADIRAMHGSHRESFIANPSSRAMGAGRDLYGVDKQGNEVPLEIGLTPIKISNECFVVASVVDITERKEYISSLEAMNKELLRSNTDLDDFAYVASHDLRSPLRAINNLAKWIEEDTNELLPEKSREDLKTLSGRVKRMEDLLDGLLEYSKIGRTNQSVELISVSESVSYIDGLLDKPEPYEVKAQGALPSFRAKKSPFQTVLRNLISNSIKHRSSDSGCVTINCSEDLDFYKISVTDDGPGIPKDQQQHIFGLFKTLKPKDDIEASGLGLAIVKKTVEREGGEVWVRNNDQSPGATFIFTWPKEPKLS